MRNEPFRLFFPLGALLAWAGVMPWLLYGVGASQEYRAVFHSVAQVQGFLTCFAVGFLFTFVPRRTGTAPPRTWELVAAAAGPVLSCAAAFDGRWALSQGLWLAAAGVVIAFAVRRLRVEQAARLPGVFLWVPIALVGGAAGAVLTLVAAMEGPHQAPQLWQLGRGLVLQGMVTGLAVGVGGSMLGAFTRGEPPAEADPLHGGRARLLNGAAALAFLATFLLETQGAPRLALALRGALCGAALAIPARLWRLPSVPGLHRRLLWAAAWLVPAGYLVAAAIPEQRAAVLHIAFIGGFGLLALAVSVHVALSHGGAPEALSRQPLRTWALGLFMGAALGFRLLAGFDAGHSHLWIALAAAAFLSATAAWAALVAPALR